MRIAAIALILFLLSLSAAAQAPTAVQDEIMAAVRAREYAVAVGGLRALRARDAEAFTRNNYDYLLARMLEAKGDNAAAAAEFQLVVGRGSILRPYALWHLAAIARATGDLNLERVHLQELAAFGGAGLLAGPAQLRLARSFFESRDHASVIRYLAAPTGGKASDPNAATLARENLALLADAYLRSGDTSRAREIYQRLTDQLANPAQPDDLALAGVKGLDLIDAPVPGQLPQLSEAEHLRRAAIYQFNRDFTDARRHYSAIAERFSGSPSMPAVLFQIGRGYSQSGEYAEALQWFERVIERFPDDPASRDALLQAGAAYARIGKYKEASGRYHTYITRFPDEEGVERAYLNILDILRDRGEDTQAAAWAQTIKERFKGKLPAALALFAEARIRLSRGEWQEALARLDELRNFPDLGGTTVAGGTTPAEVAFLRALALERLRRYPEAVNVYLAIPDGRREYYGARATERLQVLAKSNESRPAVEAKLAELREAGRSTAGEVRRQSLQAELRLTSDPDVRETLIQALRGVYANLPAYSAVPKFKTVDLSRVKQRRTSDEATTVAAELLFLGLFDEGVPEMEARGALPADSGYTVARLNLAGDHADRAIAFIEPMWRNMPGDFQIELIPREQLDLLYPVPYSDALLRHAPPRGVDPRFLLSLIRQESRFRPDVKSYSAARGLMQFISSTADRIAGEVGRENFRQSDLYDPSTAILFGAQYSADLFKLFPNQPAAAAAGYNGGEENMKRWLRRANSSEADLFVPEIVYGQSKDYVYKVMANYRMYQYLYDDKLKPQQH
jgi:soluble lytic murein transglycosylase